MSGRSSTSPRNGAHSPASVRAHRGSALAEAGLLYDMTDAYEEHEWEVFDFAKERVTFDGKLYGVPGELETIGVFYNKDVFTELGLEQPESLEDLRAASETIRDAGTIPM